MSLRTLVVLLCLSWAGGATGLAGCASGSGASPTPLPPGGVRGLVTAGPTCPVETSSPDPACEDRPVPDAELVVKNPAGAEVAKARSGKDGSFRIPLPPGDYTLVPQPVEGLLGTPDPERFRVGPSDRQPVEINLSYDTGIR